MVLFYFAISWMILISKGLFSWFSRMNLSLFFKWIEEIKWIVVHSFQPFLFRLDLNRRCVWDGLKFCKAYFTELWFFRHRNHQHSWFNGRIVAFQAIDPGSIPGGCILFCILSFWCGEAGVFCRVVCVAIPMIDPGEFVDKWDCSIHPALISNVSWVDPLLCGSS